MADDNDAPTWHQRRQDGLRLLDDYIRSHAFLHDDYWSDVEGDTDELSAHPTLASPPLVVSARSASSSSDLSTLVKIPGASPVLELLKNPRALEKVTSTIVEHHLDISAFYADNSGLEEIASRAAQLGWRPRIHPVPSMYASRVHHASNLELLAGLSKDFPTSVLASDPQAISAAFERLGPNVFLKSIDSRTVEVTTFREVLGFAEQQGYPIVVQAKIASETSFIFQWIQWKGRSRPLFIAEQILDGSHHAGNLYSAPAENRLAHEYHELFDACLTLMPDWVGPAAIDFVVSSEKAAIPIDLNARFNSSTFPLMSAMKMRRLSSLLYLRHEKPHSTRDFNLRWPQLADRTSWFGSSLDNADAVQFSLSMLRANEVADFTAQY
jgi:hypothetical protein